MDPSRGMLFAVDDDPKARNALAALKTLTPRERHLMELVVAGVPNKRIALILKISQRTVDRVRARVFEKMSVESAVGLAQVVADFRRSHQVEEQRFLLNGIPAAAKGKSAEDVENGNHLTARMLELWRRDQQSIAYEIDDGLAQYLTEAAKNLEQYERLREEKTENAGIAFDKALGLLKRGIDEVRLLIRDLQPATTDEGGIATALEDLIWDYRTEAEIEFLHEVSSKHFDPLLESTVYRIIQKSLSDACRHGQSRKIRIKLVQQEDRLCIDVGIWAVGSNPAEVGKRQFGLQEIQDWAGLLGGRASIKSAPGQGAHIFVEFPLTASLFNSPCNGVSASSREAF